MLIFLPVTEPQVESPAEGEKLVRMRFAGPFCDSDVSPRAIEFSADGGQAIARAWFAGNTMNGRLPADPWTLVRAHRQHLSAGLPEGYKLTAPLPFAPVSAAAPERVPTLVPHVMVLRLALGVPAFALILGVAAHYRQEGLGILAINGCAVLLTPLLTSWWSRRAAR